MQVFELGILFRHIATSCWKQSFATQHLALRFNMIYNLIAKRSSLPASIWAGVYHDGLQKVLHQVGHFAFNFKDFTFSNLSKQTLTKIPGEINGHVFFWFECTPYPEIIWKSFRSQQFIFEDLTDCEVRILDHSSGCQFKFIVSYSFFTCTRSFSGHNWLL